MLSAYLNNSTIILHNLTLEMQMGKTIILLFQSYCSLQSTLLDLVNFLIVAHENLTDKIAEFCQVPA